jgi:16S rRNA (guanine1207-N2)-methyltransferase
MTKTETSNKNGAFSTCLNGIELTLETAGASFSPMNIDKGTLAMLSCAEFTPNDKLLDLGCGYGVVGIYAAKLIGESNVVMSDIDITYVELSITNARKNGVGGIKIIQSDGFKGLDDTDFSMILSNPPYHSDFALPKHFIEKGFNRLRIGGKMIMVTKRKDWYKNKFISIFGGVKIQEIDDYFVFIAERRKADYAKLNCKK